MLGDMEKWSLQITIDALLILNLGPNVMASDCDFLIHVVLGILILASYLHLLVVFLVKWSQR